VTANVVEPVIAPEAALIAVCPIPIALASPVAPIDATPGVAELQVRICQIRALPLLNWPVATNCCVVPEAIEG